MNAYGRRAQRHWEKWLPNRYGAIPEADRDSFFAALGEEAEERVGTLWIDLAGDDPGGEGYLEKVGRLTNAKMRAEEIVLREMILLDPETDTPG